MSDDEIIRMQRHQQFGISTVPLPGSKGWMGRLLKKYLKHQPSSPVEWERRGVEGLSGPTLPPLRTQRKWCFAMLNRISTSTFRWIAKRKADLIARIDSGEISEAEALRLYHLSPDELAEWRRFYAEDGVWGLMEKQISQRRHI
jgi:hypothetical protein